MKKNTIKIFLTLITIFCSTRLLLAQADEGGLRMKESFWGVKFYNDNRLIRPNEVLNLMKADEEAYAAFKKAKANYDAAQVFGFVGGFMIGWPIGTAIGGGDPQWGLAAGGAGVLLLSIPFSSAFLKHSRNAIAIYNKDTGSASAWPTRVEVLPYGAGAKVVIRF